MTPELRPIKRFVSGVTYGDGTPRPVVGISLLGEGLVCVRRAVTDEHLGYLRPFRQLREGLFWITAITDRGAELLSGFGELRQLHISGRQITDEGLAAFARLSKLEHLSVYGSAIAGDRGSSPCGG